jgi:hypothetical protein
MTMTCEQIGALVLQVQDAFIHTPGLMLTPRRAQRFFNVDETACSAVLDVLADAQVLTKRYDGIYTRSLAHAA